MPVIPDSGYSVLNMEADWYFSHKLVNTGTGSNNGIDFTLEQFLKNGYSFLLTASIFDSKYKGDDGIERNTRFNTQNIVNFLYGKEWGLGYQNNNILGVNAKVNYIGGKRRTPVDIEQFLLKEDVVCKYSQLF